MIDENVNHSIQDSINELKSQLVSKVIINVPLEAEQAQKIATDNDDIVCLFLDVDPYSSVFNVSFNPQMAPVPASNISTNWGTGKSRCWRGLRLLSRRSSG